MQNAGPDCAGKLPKQIVAGYAVFKIVAGYAAFKIFKMPVQTVPENCHKIRSRVCRFQDIQMPDSDGAEDCVGNLKKIRSRVCRFQDIQMPDGPDCAGNLQKKL
jgi:hypothetical protein